jgi:hypothetical protein
MAHRIDPLDGQSYLAPPEIVRRLELEFGFVDADAARGAEQIEAMIRQFERMDFPKAVIDEHRELKPLAIHITVSDRPDFEDDYLSFLAKPGDGLLIGYHSKQHEDTAASLLVRCRAALGYQITLV